MRSDKKFLLYFSGYSKLLSISKDSTASYNRYANFEKFKIEQDNIGIQSFLCDESLLNDSDDFVNAVYDKIKAEAYNYLYKYYIGYQVPLNMNMTQEHNMKLLYSGDLFIKYDYQLNYSADNHFIFDLDTSGYPLIEFSYYSSGNITDENKLVFYENYKKNDYFGKQSQKNNELDIVFIVEDSYFSKFYNTYLLSELENFISTLKDDGYSLRIGLIRYSDSAEVNHFLSYNTEKVMRSFGKNDHYSNGFDFYSALKAIIKATEMNFLSTASKNIIFFQAEDTFFFDDNKAIDLSIVENSLLSKNINFFAFSKHPFFEELNYRVPGNTVVNEPALNSVIDYFTYKNDFDYYAINTLVDKESTLFLFDSGRLISTNYIVSLDDVKNNFRINSVTAKPFIAKPGEEVILSCKTDPVKDIKFFWKENGKNDLENFKFGNEKRTVTWIAPKEKGYYTLSVKVTYRNYSLEAETVVLVE